MANGLYQKGIADFTKTLNLETADIRAIYVNTAGAGTLYTFDKTHTSLTSVPVASRIAVSATLTITVSNTSVVDCENYSFTSVPVSDAPEALIYYYHTGTDSTSVPIAFFDTGTGMQQTPDGGNINVTVNASGLFQLVP